MNVARDAVNAVDNSLMANMHTIETPCGNNRIWNISKVIEIVKNPHIELSLNFYPHYLKMEK